jgi:hypothetical protein
MSAIWHKGEHGWALLQPIGFPDEATLHRLVADAPQVLPLAGAPRVIVLGSEVGIGSGSADLLAIEPSGRLVIIEVKLTKNSEARRAVVAQILTYAAFLKGTTRAELEQDMLAGHLAKLGVGSLFDAVDQGTQDGSLDPDAFHAGVEQSLASGSFRLVLVLDAAPPELVRLVGYLESVAPELTIDLVTASHYSAGGQPVLVPQRVEPERVALEAKAKAPALTAGAKDYYAKDGGKDFLETVRSLPEPSQAAPMALYQWAKTLEADGLATLWGFHGKKFVTLLPYPVGHESGLVTLVTNGEIWTWRSVFEKRAPNHIAAVEAAIGGPLKQGGTIATATRQFLDAVRSAYVESRERALGTSTPSSSAIGDESDDEELDVAADRVDAPEA